MSPAVEVAVAVEFVAVVAVAVAVANRNIRDFAFLSIAYDSLALNLNFDNNDNYSTAFDIRFVQRIDSDNSCDNFDNLFEFLDSVGNCYTVGFADNIDTCLIVERNNSFDFVAWMEIAVVKQFRSFSVRAPRLNEAIAVVGTDYCRTSFFAVEFDKALSANNSLVFHNFESETD